MLCAISGGEISGGFSRRRRAGSRQRDWFREHQCYVEEKGGGRFRWVVGERDSEEERKLQELRDWASSFGLDCYGEFLIQRQGR